MPDLLAQAKAIVRRTLAADLAGQPLYIIEPREGTLCGPEMGETCEGMYLDNLDSMMRPQLERDGLWEGPGVGILVNTGCDSFADLDDSHDQLRWLVGAALHEACHWLNTPFSEPVELPAAESIAKLCCVKIGLRAPVDDVFDPFAYVGAHGRAFTRLTIHAWHRCCTIGGFPFSTDWLRIGSHYPGLFILDPPSTYIQALRSELHEFPSTLKLRLLNEHHADDLGFDLPHEYAELWRLSDERIAAYLKRLQPSTEKSYASVSR